MPSISIPNKPTPLNLPTNAPVTSTVPASSHSGYAAYTSHGAIVFAVVLACGALLVTGIIVHYYNNRQSSRTYVKDEENFDDEIAQNRSRGIRVGSGWGPSSPEHHRWKKFWNDKGREKKDMLVISKPYNFRAGGDAEALVAGSSRTSLGVGLGCDKERAGWGGRAMS